MWTRYGWHLIFAEKGDGEFIRRPNIQTHTCTDGVWLLITSLTNSSYQCLGPSSVWVTFPVQSALCDCSKHLLSLFVFACVWRWVKEQRRVSQWKGFPDLRGIKVADGFTNLLFFVRKLKAINCYLTAEPLAKSIIYPSLPTHSF